MQCGGKNDYRSTYAEAAYIRLLLDCTALPDLYGPDAARFRVCWTPLHAVRRPLRIILRTICGRGTARGLRTDLPSDG